MSEEHKISKAKRNLVLALGLFAIVIGTIIFLDKADAQIISLTPTQLNKELGYKFSGTDTDVKNFIYLYGKLEYIENKIDQLQKSCGR